MCGSLCRCVSSTPCRVDCLGPAEDDGVLLDGRESECPLRGDSATPVLEPKLDEDSFSFRSDSDATVRGDSSTPKAWEERGEHAIVGEGGCGAEEEGECDTEVESITEEECASKERHGTAVGHVTAGECDTEEGRIIEEGHVPEEGRGLGEGLGAEREGDGVTLEENGRREGSIVKCIGHLCVEVACVCVCGVVSGLQWSANEGSVVQCA